MIIGNDSGPYMDDSGLDQLQVNHASSGQLGSSSAPMETDAAHQQQNQPFVDRMEIDPARQRSDRDDGAYVDDAGLNGFQIDPTSTAAAQPSQSSAPMEADATSQPSKQPVGENMRSDVAQQRDKDPDCISKQSIADNTVSNHPQSVPSSPDSVPPPWVIQMGREFLVALNAQQAQDRVRSHWK